MRRLESDERQPAAGTSRFRLRRMVAADLEAVMAIERLAFKHPWSADLFRRELGHEWSTVLVAEDRDPDGRPALVGFIIYWLVHDEIHILNVAVAPTERRRGIARLLLAECLAQSQRHGAALATLEVRRSNLAAIHLYEAFGFSTVGVRPNYYADEGEDALVMVLDIH